MTTFVLVHGAWVGEWSFDPIVPLLEARGHTALAVSLMGFGRKRHLHHPNLSIRDHIQDVVEFVTNRDLVDITLVGHSYGGSVITGAWDQLRERVNDVFYLDAGTPRDGESHFDSMLQYDGSGQIEALFGKELAAGEKLRPFPIAGLRKRDPEKAAYMQHKVMAFPLNCFTTQIEFEHGPLPDNIQKKFVLCKKNISYHHKQAQRLRFDEGWHVIELDTFHDCMWEDPNGVVEILLGARTL